MPGGAQSVQKRKEQKVRKKFVLVCPAAFEGPESRKEENIESKAEGTDTACHGNLKMGFERGKAELVLTRTRMGWNAGVTRWSVPKLRDKIGKSVCGKSSRNLGASMSKSEQGLMVGMQYRE